MSESIGGSKPARLFQPLKVGSIELQNRVILAPLTRFRANDEHEVSDELQGVYYEQRASRPGTLLITEATFISPEASGYNNAPGIWTAKQVEGWTKVFKRIHQKKSFVFVQLWALGRAASPKILQAKGLRYIAPSAVQLYPERNGKVSVPESLTIPEIKKFVGQYVQAAKNAVAAGADGVEIHSANGYLPDQFLHDNSNLRTDQYGGSIENKARFILEVVDAIIEAIGAGKLGIRLSPWTTVNEVYFEGSPIPTFSYLIDQLERRAKAGNQLAYIHLIEPRVNGIFDVEAPPIESNKFALPIWSGVFVRAGGIDKKDALEFTENDNRVAVALGRHFIANPDIVNRFENNLALTKYDRSTFYSKGPKGYIDYKEYQQDSSAKL